MNANYSEALEQQFKLHRQMTRRDWHSIARKVPFIGNRHESGAFDLANKEEELTAHILTHAQTFYWDAAMGPLLERAAQTLPLNRRLNKNDLPAHSGFVWFAQAQRTPAMQDSIGADLLAEAVRIVPSFQIDIRRAGFVWSCSSSDVLLIDLMTSQGMPECVPGALVNWGYGDSLGQTCIGLDSTEQELARCVSAAMTLLSQKIVVASQHQAERHVRRRLQRDGWSGETAVRIVELRRREHVSNKDAVEPVEREWSCQWVVRGHWRQQYYATKHANQPIWITPYVKGPEDKPLKTPRATVFAVVR